jgi:hypothetical protein
MIAGAGQMQIARLDLVPAVMVRPVMIAAPAPAAPAATYQNAVDDQQGNAPIFTVSPGAPGTYASSGGKSYVVPAARIAFRANLPRTPDVSFRRDGQGYTLQLTIELVLPAGTDPSATVLLLDGYSVAILPGDNGPPFNFTKVVPLVLSDRGASVIGVLQASAPIDETIGLELLRTKPNATVVVSGQAHYRQVVVRHRPAPVWPGEFGRPEGINPLLRPSLVNRQLLERVTLEPASQPAAVTAPGTQQSSLGYTTTTENLTATITLTNAASCYFPSDLRDNKPIFAAILGDDADVSVWSNETSSGYTRPSPSPDEFNTLPTEFRLAFDSNTGLPSMSVILITKPPAQTGGPASYSVRVRFAIAPLLDGTKLELMRAALRGKYEIPYPKLSIGGYTAATFVPSGLFQNLPGFAADGAGAQQTQIVDAASGFELIMDCSLECYTLLTKMLATLDGISGSVQFTLVTGRDDSNPPVETTTMVSVPVTLSLVGPLGIQPGTQLQSGTVADPAATSVSIAITNPLAVPLAINGVYPTVIASDAQLGVTTSATPLVPTVTTAALAPNGSITVVAQSPDGKPLGAFTALATAYGTTTPTFDPNAVLQHYHELAVTTGISATAHVACYLLKHPDQIPASLAGLIGMQIEVQRDGGQVVSVPLTRDAPESDVQIPYTFGDLLAGLSLDEPTFKYRAKTIFPDRTGDFSAWIDNTGHDVLVVPV